MFWIGIGIGIVAGIGISYFHWKRGIINPFMTAVEDAPDNIKNWFEEKLG